MTTTRQHCHHCHQVAPLETPTGYGIGDTMATMTIRNIPDDVYRAIRVRAALNDRSAEAEVRAVLEELVEPMSGTDLAQALLEFGRQVGLTDEEHALFERDKSPAREIDLP